jgi:hypothetical protein
VVGRFRAPLSVVFVEFPPGWIHFRHKGLSLFRGYGFERTVRGLDHDAALGESLVARFSFFLVGAADELAVPAGQLDFQLARGGSAG